MGIKGKLIYSFSTYYKLSITLYKLIVKNIFETLAFLNPKPNYTSATKNSLEMKRDFTSYS